MGSHGIDAKKGCQEQTLGPWGAAVNAQLDWGRAQIRSKITILMPPLIHEGKGQLIEVGVEVYYVLREPRAGEESIKGVIRASGPSLSIGTYTLQADEGRKIKLIIEELIYQQSARVHAISGFF